MPQVSLACRCASTSSSCRLELTTVLFLHRTRFGCTYLHSDYQHLCNVTYCTQSHQRGTVHSDVPVQSESLSTCKRRKQDQTRCLQNYNTNLNCMSACRLANSTSSLTLGGTFLAISFMLFDVDLSVKETNRPGLFSNTRDNNKDNV